MRITVDSTRCQGHNLCLSYLPHLLEPDDLGYVTPISDGHVADDDLEAAHTAVAGCPEEALSLTANEGASA